MRSPLSRGIYNYYNPPAGGLRDQFFKGVRNLRKANPRGEEMRVCTRVLGIKWIWDEKKSR